MRVKGDPIIFLVSLHTAAACRCIHLTFIDDEFDYDFPSFDGFETKSAEEKE